MTKSSFDSECEQTFIVRVNAPFRRLEFGSNQRSNMSNINFTNQVKQGRTGSGITPREIHVPFH